MGRGVVGLVMGGLQRAVGNFDGGGGQKLSLVGRYNSRVI
jgi:hypothetical protein